MRHPQVINMKQNKYPRARTKEVKHNKVTKLTKRARPRNGEVNCFKM